MYDCPVCKFKTAMRPLEYEWKRLTNGVARCHNCQSALTYKGGWRNLIPLLPLVLVYIPLDYLGWTREFRVAIYIIVFSMMASLAVIFTKFEPADPNVKLSRQGKQS